ncbi:MAG: ParB N-terminal domain-containing protein [Planctomycetes bacterium]|nr:ParB N-terminal domain-containing protein [Planctomycetota bacterium]
MTATKDATTPKFAVELRKIDDIRPYERNPRINDQAVDAVGESLQQFGFRQPIVVNEDGTIIVGHTRWKAAQKLGLAKVPVHVATDLTPEQVRAYRIADNKTGELAEWDLLILPIEISELTGGDIDFESLGFDGKELAQLLNDSQGVQQGLTDPDDVPEPPDDPITQRGDIWVLGNHRLMCGDSGSVENLDRLLDGATIDLVNMDPPYNVRLMYRVAA